MPEHHAGGAICVVAALSARVCTGRHWFTYRGFVGSSAPSCRRCGEPNPRYDLDRDPYPGGWYCPDCGVTYERLPVGIVTCHAGCGRIGLRGFNGRTPRRFLCRVDGCDLPAWDDGGVTSADYQHRHDHAGLARRTTRGA